MNTPQGARLLSPHSVLTTFTMAVMSFSPELPQPSLLKPCFLGPPGFSFFLVSVTTPSPRTTQTGRRVFIFGKLSLRLLSLDHLYPFTADAP